MARKLIYTINKTFQKEWIYTLKTGEKEILTIYYSSDLYYSDWHWASIYSINANKGIAIKKLLDYLNIDNHYLTVFGDHHNDVDMFNIANKSVAVGNAQKELLVQADMIIGKNTEDSVINYIKKDVAC